jgi:hypothetical protein
VAGVDREHHSKHEQQPDQRAHDDRGGLRELPWRADPVHRAFVTPLSLRRPAGLPLQEFLVVAGGFGGAHQPFVAVAAVRVAPAADDDPQAGERVADGVPGDGSGPVVFDDGAGAVDSANDVAAVAGPADPRRFHVGR